MWILPSSCPGLVGRQVSLQTIRTGGGRCPRWGPANTAACEAQKLALHANQRGQGDRQGGCEICSEASPEEPFSNTVEK